MIYQHMRIQITPSFLISTIIMVALFIIAEIVAHAYEPTIISITEQYTILGKVFFVLMAAIAVIIPLWSNMLLLPIGAVAWGPFTASVLCILGWWTGSVISFFLARTYRDAILTRYTSLTEQKFVDSLISPRHKLLSLIFLRMTLPVDILSYALGLFSQRVTWKENAVTTFIGIIPFAFVFSYIGIFSPQTQGMVLILSVILFAVYYIFTRKESKTTSL